MNEPPLAKGGTGVCLGGGGGFDESFRESTRLGQHDLLALVVDDQPDQTWTNQPGHGPVALLITDWPK